MGTNGNAKGGQKVKSPAARLFAGSGFQVESESSGAAHAGHGATEAQVPL